MSTAVLSERFAEASPRFKARAAGLFWLMTALTGSYTVFISGRIVVSGNPAATAANILAQEFSFRLGLAADLLATACYTAATLLVYDLLKPVNRNLSLLVAFFCLLGCASGAAGFVFHLGPVVVLGGAKYLSVFTVVRYLSS